MKTKRKRINRTTGQPVRTLSNLFNKALEAGLTKKEANHRVKMVSINIQAHNHFNNI